MRIACPYCGTRDLREFTFLGDAQSAGLAEPDTTPASAGWPDADRIYFRDNPAGRHRGLWYHENGCRSWLAIERDTRTHEIFSVVLAGGKR